jgi:hypothetical protein
MRQKNADWRNQQRYRPELRAATRRQGGQRKHRAASEPRRYQPNTHERRRCATTYPFLLHLVGLLFGLLSVLLSLLCIFGLLFSSLDSIFLGLLDLLHLFGGFLLLGLFPLLLVLETLLLLSLRLFFGFETLLVGLLTLLFDELNLSLSKSELPLLVRRGSGCDS